MQKTPSAILPPQPAPLAWYTGLKVSKFACLCLSKIGKYASAKAKCNLCYEVLCITAGMLGVVQCCKSKDS